MAAASKFLLTAVVGSEKGKRVLPIILLALLVLILMPVIVLVIVLAIFSLLQQDGDYCYPLEYTHSISSSYGARTPITVYVSGYGYMTTSDFHKGVDFAAPTGTPIYASCGGTVTTAANLGAYGNCIVITKENGDYTRYFHLNTIDVAVGDSIVSGAPIGTVGNTGISTGAHLHFEIWIAGEHVDPTLFLKERTEEPILLDSA